MPDTFTRGELIAHLRGLIAATQDSTSTQCAAAVLASLAGALVSGADEELMRICTDFSKTQLRTLKAREN